MRRLLAVALLVLCVPIAPARMGRGGISTAGFLPAGHFMPAKQSMLAVFPRPDTETNTWAREHWAFYNGSVDIPYDIKIVVDFGAYPYVFQLLSGPPGMTIEQPIHSSFQNVGYGRILWHPQGNITQQCNDSNSCSYTVSVLVTDQQHNSITMSWKLQTDDDSTTYESARHFVFISASGSGSTCTYAAPCLPSAAFGTTFAANTFPGAIAYAFGGTYTGTSNLPQYTDNDIFGSSTPLFEVSTTNKPAALIGIPGQTVTFDASTIAGGTSGSLILAAGDQSADWYMENIQANGYYASNIDRGIELFAPGSSTNIRQTFDQVVWNNSGYGTGASNNMSMFVSSGNATPRQYLAIVDSSEINRESGAVGNNYAFCDLYSEEDFAVDENTESSASSNFDAVFYEKSDVYNGEVRENYANVNGANDAFSVGQNQYIVSGNDEIEYNLGLNVAEIIIPQTPGYTLGQFWVMRNTLLATGNGYASLQAAYNLEGPQQNTPTATTGSLAANTYYSKITSLGLSGESAGVNGILGGGNEKSITLSSTGGITFNWTDIANAPGGYNVYVGTSSGGENTQFHVAAGTTTFTYTGQTGTSATPPSTSTAVTANTFEFDSNIAQGASASVVTGATIGGDGLNVTATSGLINSDGTLYSGNPNYSTYLGTRGFQIQ